MGNCYLEVSSVYIKFNCSHNFYFIVNKREFFLSIILKFNLSVYLIIMFYFCFPSDVNESLLSKALYSSRNTDPDILIRTSGEIRLSDFLLWQSCYSLLSFFKVFWPDFRIWHLFFAVLYYQHFHDEMKVSFYKFSSQINLVLYYLLNQSLFTIADRAGKFLPE